MPWYTHGPVAILGDAVISTLHREVLRSLIMFTRLMPWKLTSVQEQDKRWRYAHDYILMLPQWPVLIWRKQDAYILGRLLTQPQITHSRILEALEIYDSIRRPFANGVVNATRRVGQLYEFEGIDIDGPSTASNASGKITNTASLTGEGKVAPKSEWAKRWGDEVLKLWRWQWEDGPDADWVEAQKTLLAKSNESYRAYL